MSKNFDKCLQVAKSQEGVFARYQVDVRDQDLSYHTKAGNLERIRTGIYRIAQTPYSDAEEYIVAYLWSREEGTLSHETALMLHDLSDALPNKIHLTVPTSWKSKSRKIPDSYELHFGDLKSDEKGWYSAARVTNPLRTLKDVSAAGLDPDLVEQAMDQARRRGMVDDNVEREVLRFLILHR
jgi:predicted transcriptional regulator of viral defense system